jgi:hypothetical protein
MNEVESEPVFDPDAPFIAKDGLEYEDLAAYILGRPTDCWRNRRIQEYRQAGRSEEALRQWIKGYDGDDPRTTSQLTSAERAYKQVDANFAVCPHGLGLI